MEWVELVPTYVNAGTSSIDPDLSGNYHDEHYYSMEVDPALGQFAAGEYITHLRFTAAGDTYSYLDQGYVLSYPLTDVTIVMRNTSDNSTASHTLPATASDTYEVELAPYYALQSNPDEWVLERVLGDTRYSEGPTGTAEYTIEAVVEFPPEVDENFWSRYIDTKEVMRSISE